MSNEVSFDVSPEDEGLIWDIANRAWNDWGNEGWPRKLYKTQVDLVMDITAVHANGNPLRLTDLLSADAFNFSHDIGGIRNHLDRETGKLTQCFRPRFSQPAAA